MTEEENDYSPSAAADDGALERRRRRKKISLWRPSLPRWIPTSTDHMIAAEKRLLSLVKTPYTQEQVNIGRSPAGLRKKRRRRRPLFKPASIRRNGVGEEEEQEEEEERFINTITFINNSEESSREGEEGTTPAPTLVMLHGHGAPLGVFFRNFDSLAKHFIVIAIDQLGWGRSSRPNVTCKNTQESEAWFIDSFEEWRKAKNLTNFILLGHSLGGYVAAKYALQHPEHVKHLIVVGPVGFTYDDNTTSGSSLLETILDYFWKSNSRFTQHNLFRALGPIGPRIVHKYIVVDEVGEDVLNKEESKCFADYVYHMCATKRPSGERCSKHLFTLGGFARSPLLLERRKEWRVSTTVICGSEDDFNDKIAVEASKKLKVDFQIISVSEGGDIVLMQNADAFHAAVVYACRSFLNLGQDYSLPPGLDLVTPK